MQIAIELPNDFVAFQSQGQIQRDIRLSYALWLFKNERVTIAKAAELADMDIYDFKRPAKKTRYRLSILAATSYSKNLKAGYSSHDLPSKCQQINRIKETRAIRHA